jgi:hypothetical protein
MKFRVKGDVQDERFLQNCSRNARTEMSVKNIVTRWRIILKLILGQWVTDVSLDSTAAGY